MNIKPIKILILALLVLISVMAVIVLSVTRFHLGIRSKINEDAAISNLKVKYSSKRK